MCDDGETQDNYIEDFNSSFMNDDDEDEWDDEQTIQKEWCFQGEGKWGSLMRGLWMMLSDW